MAVLRIDPAVSEAVLRNVVPALRAGLDELDTLGRLGPAELAVLLDDVANRDVAELAAQFEAALTTALAGAADSAGSAGAAGATGSAGSTGSAGGWRVSCGLVTSCGHLGSAEDVLREADIAAHRAQARRAAPRVNSGSAGGSGRQGIQITGMSGADPVSE
jgi:GGDEF domain-containing protein